jgi:hypothetical protein
MDRQAKPAGSVENDPEPTWSSEICCVSVFLEAAEMAFKSLGLLYDRR